MSEWTDQDIENYYKAHPGLKPVLPTDNARKLILHEAEKRRNKYHTQRKHPEKELEQFVHDTAKACGLLYYHTYRSRFSEPGFPDCIIIGKWMVVAELKDTGKNPTPAQQRWLDAFKVADVAVRVWHPEDRDCILQILMGMR